MKTICIIFIAFGFPHLNAMEPFRATLSTPDSIYKSVEQSPEFPGGDTKFMQFLQKNLEIPTPANEDEVVGKVFLKFVIDTDGSVTNLTVTGAKDPALEKEIKRVFGICAKFKPGMQGGRPVKVYYTLPIYDIYGR